MYTGQGNKEQVSQGLKDGFLIFYLLLRKLTQKIVNQLTNYLSLPSNFRLHFSPMTKLELAPFTATEMNYNKEYCKVSEPAG
jgi:hypothetical protein